MIAATAPAHEISGQSNHLINEDPLSKIWTTAGYERLLDMARSDASIIDIMSRIAVLAIHSRGRTEGWVSVDTKGSVNKREH